MPKKGDRFIIEVDAVYTCGDGTRLYRIKGFNSLVFDKNGIDRLRPFDRAAVETAAYNTGMRDAWNTARIIENDIPLQDLAEIFPSEIPGDIYDEFTPSEAKAAIEHYLKEKERRKTGPFYEEGDVVVNADTKEKGVVVYSRPSEHSGRHDVLIMTSKDFFAFNVPLGDPFGAWDKTGEKRGDIGIMRKAVFG